MGRVSGAGGHLPVSEGLVGSRDDGGCPSKAQRWYHRCQAGQAQGRLPSRLLDLE